MFSTKIHRYLFLFGSCALFLGVMLGTVPTSVPQFILLGNWLLEGKFREKWMKLKTNKLFWVISSVFFIHVIGLIYTSDIKAGWDDVRTKIPLLLLPLIYFSTAPLLKKEFHYLLYSFVLGSFLNISWCLIYDKVLHHSEQIRNVSRFMSHIRLGFLIDLAIVFCIYFLILLKAINLKLLFGLLVVFFVYGLYILGLMSGIANLSILSVFFLLFIVLKKNKLVFFLITLFLVIFTFFVTSRVQNFYKANFQIKNDAINNGKLITSSGRPYSNYLFTNQVENGYLVAKNVQIYEVQKQWNKIVPGDSFNIQTKYNTKRYFTLLRFLSSKGVTKDSVTVSKLTPDELKDISNGFSNINYSKWSFINKRLYELLYDYFEYKNNGTVNGHSFTMRLFYLKSALCAIKKDFVFGAGTGDVQLTMNECYMQSASPLDKEWYKRPHNQFVTIFVALGLMGLIVFLISLIYPILILRKELSLLYWLFIISAIVSFLFEDTLETQSGLSFFAIFNTLFITHAYFNRKETIENFPKVML